MRIPIVHEYLQAKYKKGTKQEPPLNHQAQESIYDETELDEIVQRSTIMK